MRPPWRTEAAGVGAGPDARAMPEDAQARVQKSGTRRRSRNGSAFPLAGTSRSGPNPFFHLALPAPRRSFSPRRSRTLRQGGGKSRRACGMGHKRRWIRGALPRPAPLFLQMPQALPGCGEIPACGAVIRHLPGLPVVIEDQATGKGIHIVGIMGDDHGRDGQISQQFQQFLAQALAQQRVAGLRFDIALFTNLTQDHLDYHGTFENYRAAKHKLFEQAEQAVINFDDPSAAAIIEGTRSVVTTYSIRQDGADFTAKNVRDLPDCVEYELVGNGMIGRVHLGIPGHFSVYNSMGALLCAMKAGVPFQQALSALRAAKGVKGRIEVVPTNTDYTVIIDYAHSPDGLENILSSLREIAHGRILCVFGCGGDRDRTKRPKMGAVVASLADVAVVTSDNPRSEEPNQIIADVLEGMREAPIPVHVEPDRTKAIRLAMRLAQKDDIVLLAGKGHETYQVLKAGKIHYDEREIVAQILEELKQEV